MPVNLATFDNSWYSSGRSGLVRALWFFVGLPLLRSSWIPFSGFRRWLLRTFGTKMGFGVVIKPGVRVKYPWLLEIGDYCWIGEDVWIDNLATVEIGANVCLSQGVYLCTGNHDWSDPAFGLTTGPITIREGAWLSAKVVVCPGTEIGPGAVAGAGSVVNKRLEPYTIYAGNPAKAIKPRILITPEIRASSAI